MKSKKTFCVHDLKRTECINCAIRERADLEAKDLQHEFLRRMNIYASNITMLHRLGTGSGPVSVSPETCRKMLVMAGVEAVKIYIEETAKMDPETVEIPHSE